jgi:hypothetical protein
MTQKELEVDVDVSRRDLGALLGALGGAVGLAAISGCSESSGASADEQVATVSEALTGATSLRWFDTYAELRTLVGVRPNPR